MTTIRRIVSTLMAVLFCTGVAQAEDGDASAQTELWTHLSSATELVEVRGMSAQFDDSGERRVLRLEVPELNVALGETPEPRRGIAWVSIPPPVGGVGFGLHRERPGHRRKHRLQAGGSHPLGGLVRRVGRRRGLRHAGAQAVGDTPLQPAGNVSRRDAKDRSGPDSGDPRHGSADRHSSACRLRAGCHRNGGRMGATGGPDRRAGHGGRRSPHPVGGFVINLAAMPGQRDLLRALPAAGLEAREDAIR